MSVIAGIAVSNLGEASCPSAKTIKDSLTQCELAHIRSNLLEFTMKLSILVTSGGKHERAQFTTATWDRQGQSRTSDGA